MKLFLFSIQCLATTTTDKWSKKPVLFFVDAYGKRHTKIVSNYVPYVLVHPRNESLDPSDVEACLLDDKRITSKTLYVEEVFMTPLVGFTNDRHDRLFKIHYTNICDKYAITTTLESEIDVTVIHGSFSNEMLLLHITGWRLQKWYHCDNETVHVKRGDLSMDPEDDTLPPLSFAFIRLTIKSSTATSSNVFLPDHTIPNDTIECCGISKGRIGMDTVETYTIQQSNDEKQLIGSIRKWLLEHDPCIIVHMSDPLDHVSYLHFRSKLHGVSSGLSVYGCTENLNMNDKSYRDLSCPGREVVDILHILQKFMISPSLDGYTLQDAYDHPKLLRQKDNIEFDRDVDPTLLPLKERIRHTQNEIQIMVSLQKDNSFILNNLALSSSCDLSLFRIISRGQQARAFACFARAYHEKSIYINHRQFESPYIIVNKPRMSSSFPDPVWIDNPPIESLTIQPTTQSSSVEQSPRKKRKTVADVLGLKKKTGLPPKTKKRYGGGFVIVPEPGLYSDPRQAVVTLDFASLYPSIMRGYKRCFMSVCYDEKWLHDDKAEKEYVPLDDHTCCVFIKSYDGKPIRTVTDDIVYNVMKNRKEVRARMKTTKDPFLLQSMDAQQLCCKVLQNAFYGACGSETFSIPCTAIAASICVIGQWMNKTVRYRGMLRGGRCVYGDTDSVMFQLPTSCELTTRDEILRDIYRQARELEEETTKLFPEPNAVEFEALKLPHLQTKMKKTYGAIEYPPCPDGWKKTGSILIKGFAIKKRDRCTFTQIIGKELIHKLFNGGTSDHDLRVWFNHRVRELFTNMPTEHKLVDFIITCRLNTEYKQDNVLALELADQYEKETGSRPRPGCRLRYVIAEFKYEDRKHFQMAITPTSFLKNKRRLDASYYLGKQLLLPIKQVLDLKPNLYEALRHDIESLIVRYSVNAKCIRT